MNNYKSHFSTMTAAALTVSRIIYCCTVDKNCAGCPMDGVEWHENDDEELQGNVTPCAFPYNVLRWLESEVEE